MIIAFELSMPSVASWNGKWSGEGRKYVIVRNVGASKKAVDKYTKIVKRGYYHYSFGDGWAAGIQVKEIDRSIARKLKTASAGFCGYDWMVTSICDDGEIYGPARPRAKAIRALPLPEAK